MDIVHVQHPVNLYIQLTREVIVNFCNVGCGILKKIIFTFKPRTGRLILSTALGISTKRSLQPIIRTQMYCTTGYNTVIQAHSIQGNTFVYKVCFKITQQLPYQTNFSLITLESLLSEVYMNPICLIIYFKLHRYIKREFKLYSSQNRKEQKQKQKKSNKLIFQYKLIF